MAIPAIPPVLIAEELELELDVAAGLCEEEVVVVAGEGAEVAGTTVGMNCDVEVTVPEEITPLGPRLRYALQSGFSASGHVSSWQRLYNCVPTAGEHRTLYFAFNCDDSSSASCGANPKY